ncbi:MAG: DUF4286 domain-containing protein [Flavobacteriales bacterium CG_4_9_14_3_um_filter_32_8]|nr:MAG: DUF4286 domain-containing protein [Flavobacteriales bacterium CG_4_9_14_3_um_filter_32_8]
MIIYNVTVNVEEEIHADWIVWMKEVHIPAVMNTGVFIENKICKVLSTTEDETGHTYAVQYTCLSMEDLENYQQNHAPRLQKEHLDRYQGKFVAFRTLLEVI